MIVERAAPGSIKGEKWRVSWFDRELQEFVGASGRSAWNALAWAMVVREEQRLRLPWMPARNTKDTPKSVLAKLRAPIAPIAAPQFLITPVATSAATRRSQTKRKKVK